MNDEWEDDIEERLARVEELVKDCAQALAGVISIVEKAVEESGTRKIVLPR